MNIVEVIHESDELLVLNKPAGLVCHPTKGDAYSSLIGRVRLHLNGAKAHLINRLDRETSGVVVVAKTDEAARTVRRLWEGRRVVKEYRAIVHGRMPSLEGTITAPLGKDDSSPVAIKDCVRPDGSLAETEYRVLKIFARGEKEFSLLRVHPKTGRKHQIRIHLAHMGCPVVGDKLYGLDEQFYLDLVNGRLTAEQREKLILPHQALHASLVRFEWQEAQIEFKAEPEAWFHQFIES